MDFLKAILMGILQGLTEFLPVSSSGHLTVLNRLFRTTESSGVFFLVLLHLGTLLAICFYLRSDIRRILIELIRLTGDLAQNTAIYFHNRFHEETARDYRKLLYNNYRKLAVMLLISSIPTGLLGYFLQPVVNHLTGSVLAAGLGFLLNGVLLLTVSNWKVGKTIPRKMKLSHAWMIGIFQGFGIFPGISRMGITMTAGILCGLNRESSVRYSLLLSIPAVIGAIILETNTLSGAAFSWRTGGCWLLGIIAAGVTGYGCIRFMIKLTKTRGFTAFAVYSFLLGIASIACHFVLA